MSIYKELDYNTEISDIKELQFSVSSPEEIRRKSVVHVTQYQPYDNNLEPIINGLFDPRLGVLDLGKKWRMNIQDLLEEVIQENYNNKKRK